MNQEKLLSDSNINSKDALPGEKVGGYTAASILWQGSKVVINTLSKEILPDQGAQVQ